MININADLMKEYELENRDSIVNYTDVVYFYEKYIIWLEKKIMNNERSLHSSKKSISSPRLKRKIESIVDAKVNNTIGREEHSYELEIHPSELSLYFRRLKVTQAMKDYAITYYRNNYVKTFK